MLILEMIRSAAFASGERIAVHSNSGEMSYQELWRKSDSLAVWLDRELKSDRTPVVVYGHKSPMMLVCFLACVKSGRAYCPIDTSMADERTADIIETVGNRLVLATEEMPESIKAATAKFSIVTADEIETAAAAGEECEKNLWVRKGDVFYIIFTSGSSGKPKGVKISAGNLTSFVGWFVGVGDSRKAKSGGIFLNQAPFSFDLSVMDTYTCLATGGTLWCLDEKTRKDTKAMLKYLKDGRLNYWVSTPSFAELCLAEQDFDEKLMPDIRYFYFCGETLPADTAGRLMERFPKAKVINTYGPTETTVAVTSVEITEAMVRSGRPLPIGRTKEGTRIFLREGELVISGDTVSMGYYKDPMKTEKSFFMTDDYEWAYRTGDAGSFDSEMLYYGGRIDGQVKLHGYRIELGDIESNLLKLPGVSGAAVVAKREGGQVKSLAAFIKPKEQNDGGFEERQKIRRQLKERLPEYMVPKKIVFVDDMPLTANGKIDRRRLEAQI